ncbi:50S ribosomal protein L21 [Candidatus Gracilibacteria bacterium HOT-871]|nr:50S ribosomal protein L21 [Candidatus Gracilibacteria bacterium HOT-871]MBB1564921.1 50S ribosomal protein L21 [Candidatus Gracilibacteria bacterium]RKW21820.1 MAG: 50S ribosomal protein L21 [Candidatus Gracilibacteria bacterium]
MLAVIELGGNQFTVKKGDVIDVKKLDKEVSSTFDVEALLVSDDDGKETKVGTPFVSGSKVELKVLEQFKGEKVRVFKMKSKKRYMRNNGFRAHLTKLEVISVA